MKNQANIERRRMTPQQFPQTMRPDFRALKTSARAGRVYPAAFIPMMPNDSCKSGSSASIVVNMEPTVKTLANAVHFRASAHFVSYAALDRFDGMDSVAFAHAGKAGAPSIVDTATYADATHGELYKAFGEHLAEGETFNTLYHRAYNQVVNHRRQIVSESLPERLETDCTLARALWGQTAIARVVPDFDQALIQAEAQLTLSGELPIDGLAVQGNTSLRSNVSNLYPANEEDVNATTTYSDARKANDVYLRTEDGAYDVFADLAAATAGLSLANIDQAKQIREFAKVRATMAGTDEELIDLLMRGIHVPRSAYHQPILIGQASGVIGQTERYATDSANLEDYLAEGATRVNIPLRMPAQETGGVIVITYEVIPEPVFDRQADMFLRKTYDEMPSALRDYLDTQPVQVVPNRFVDALHSNADGTFGYAPMNYDMIRRRVGVGGRFLRTNASTPTDEDQSHIWSVRQEDPVLDEDAFLVPSDFNHAVFRDALADPFFVMCTHNATIQGDTQFGPALYESTGEYEAVAAIAPTDVITPPSES